MCHTLNLQVKPVKKVFILEAKSCVSGHVTKCTKKGRIIVREEAGAGNACTRWKEEATCHQERHEGNCATLLVTSRTVEGNCLLKRNARHWGVDCLCWAKAEEACVTPLEVRHGQEETLRKEEF